MIGTPDAKGAFASSVHRPGGGLDWWLLGSAAVLLFLGLAAIHSIDISRTTAPFMFKQLLWAFIGVGALVVCASITQRAWMRWAPVLYTLSVASLLAVLLIGKNTKGATRWIEVGPLQFQPSEMAKVLLIITLATYFTKRQAEVKDFKTFFGSLLHVAPVAGLVLMQPHLAGCLSLIMIWLAISLYAGVPWKFVLGTGVAVACLCSVALFTPGVLPPYMQGRVYALTHPDPKKNTYQQDRAKIAFGVGGLTGVGYGHGEQKAARNIPEQQNDFIFTVIGEEGGLVGAGLTLAAFVFFFFRVWLVGYRSVEPFGQMLSAGVLAVLGFHTIINLGMNVGILPVAGLWLPFISYGGTALWMCMACVGLLVGAK